MKQETFQKKLYLFALIATMTLHSFAQQHLTLTCNNSTNTNGSRECNTACALIYTPPLNDKAILLAYQSPAGSRTLGVWCKKVNGLWIWNVNYQDAKMMNYGEKFEVEYYDNPDPDYQFVHNVYQTPNAPKIDTSYIDHVNLNGNPKANFRYIARGNGTNMYPVTFQYDRVKARWYLFNTNHKQLDLFAAYNIVIEKGNAFTKPDITIDTSHPKIITRLTDTIPVKSPVNNGGSCNCTIPGSLPPNGNAGGDLGGTYPSPSVIKIAGRPVSGISPQTGDALIWNGVAWEPAPEKAAGNGTNYIAGLGLALNGNILSALKDDPIWNAAKIVGRDVSTNPPTVGQVLKWAGGAWVPADENSGNSATGWSLNGNNLINTNTGNVVIGNPTSNSTLSFPATLGKKITLYPGASGDVGIGVAGNRLQIYADNPNADVAIGYDAAGTFTERLAVKANGALAINGNTGQPGQVLTSGGNSGPPVWASGGNNIQTFFKNATYPNSTTHLTSSNRGYIFTPLMHNLTITKKSRLIISANFYLIGPMNAFGAPNGNANVTIIINGIHNPNFYAATVGNSTFTSLVISNFMYDVNPGNYLIEFLGELVSGSEFDIVAGQSSIIVVPLE